MIQATNGKPTNCTVLKPLGLNTSPPAQPTSVERARTRVADLLIRFRIPILIVVHALIFAIGYFLAYALRLDFEISIEMQQRFWKSLPFVVTIEIGCFLYFRTFLGWWSYVKFRDLVSFFKPLVVSSVLISIVDRFVFNALIPRSVFVQLVCSPG